MRKHYPLFDFDADEMIAYAEKMNAVQQEIEYLEYAGKEYRKMNPGEADEDFDEIREFLEVLEEEIAYRKKIAGKKFELSDFPKILYDFEKIRRYADSMDDLAQAKFYLLWALKEVENHDYVLKSEQTSLMRKIGNELHFKQLLSERENQIKNSGVSEKRTKNNKVDKIIWTSTDTNLVYFVSEFIKAGLIISDKPYILIRDHFQKENGDSYDPEKLKRLKYNFKNYNKSNKPKDTENIDQVRDHMMNNDI